MGNLPEFSTHENQPENLSSLGNAITTATMPSTGAKNQELNFNSNKKQTNPQHQQELFHPYFDQISMDSRNADLRVNT